MPDACSIAPASSMAMEERLDLTATTFLIIISSIGKRVPKQQLSSPCKMSSYLERGFQTMTYSFKNISSHSLKYRSSRLVPSLFNSANELSVTQTTAS